MSAIKVHSELLQREPVQPKRSQSDVVPLKAPKLKAVTSEADLSNAAPFDDSEPEAARRGQVRSFRAQSMEQATELVRRELGSDAIIVSSRQLVNKGRFPWSQTSGDVVVTARSMVVAEQPRVGREQLNRNDPRNRRVNRAPLSVTMGQAEQQATQPPPATVSAQVSPQVTPHVTIPVPVPEPVVEPPTVLRIDEVCEQIAQQLQAVDVEASIADELIGSLKGCADETQLEDADATSGLLNAIIESRISIANPRHVVAGTRQVVALVGPSGVGKTTTLTKLAAQLIFNESAKIALITFDTFRIAAVEQLRAYAGIIEIPVHVVTSPIEMERAIEDTQDVDFVLIDTSGHNPNDELRMQQLKQMLAEAGADTVFLCLGATASSPSVKRCSERFAAIGADSVIVTKMDEASGPGSVLTLVNATDLPLAYLSNGQNVPEDLEPVNATRIARMITDEMA